jgi:pimeloyl-ACP methyl ester carboxylesterase
MTMGRAKIWRGALGAIFAVALWAGLSGCAARSSPPQAVTGYVTSSDGAILDYAVLGQGPPLLLVTGYATTAGMWDAAFVRGLAAAHTVILMDNRGMGPSGLPAGAEVSIPGMAGDAAAVLDALGLGPADVLGWSMGGMIAQELALDRPDAVRALVLLCSAADVGPVLPALDRMAGMSAAQIREAMFPAGWAGEHPGVWGRIAPRTRSPDMNVVRAQEVAMRAFPGTMGRLGELRVPVLLLAGGADWVCPPEASRAVFEHLEDRDGPATVLSVAGQGGHWMMHQFPDMLAGMVNGFLAARP